MSGEPIASSTAGDTKFSLAISSRPSLCRVDLSSIRVGDLGIATRAAALPGRHARSSVLIVTQRFVSAASDVRRFRSSPRAARGVRPRTACRASAFRISTPARPSTNRAGRTSTFASLCSRASSAISGFHATAARTCGYRLARVAMPSPVPQSRMPRSRLPLGNLLRERMRVVGIVDRLGCWPEVLDVVAHVVRARLELLLQLEAGVVGAMRILHSRLRSAAMNRTADRESSHRHFGSLATARSDHRTRRR